MRSCIKISETHENIILTINDESDHKDIVENLKKKISTLKKIYKETKMPILIAGKALKDIEKLEIKNIIKIKIDAKILFEAPQELGLHGIKKSFDREIESSQTKFHKGSVRSGQKIEYDGSLVILGDVNAGAEVIAEDNVIILGILRGLAHAGARGNKKAIIAAASIDCKQIRIANIIKEIEQKDEDGNLIEISTKKNYAYVENEEILLE